MAERVSVNSKTTHFYKKKKIQGVREEKLGFFYYTSLQKFYDNVFLFVGLIILGTLLNFERLVHKVECSTTNCNLQKI